MVKGHIECNYVKGISEKRIAAMLKNVDPVNADARKTGISQKLNPRRYHAPYFGYNLHVDQNEKVFFNFYCYCQKINSKICI
jgi:hypothetical protein